MRKNVGMSRRPRAWVVLLGLILGAGLLATSCGRSGFQYLESEDERVFIKIPDDWQVSEGRVDWVYKNQYDQANVFPGEIEEAWRATFQSGPGLDTNIVAGFLDVQPIDRSRRDEVNVDALFGFDWSDTEDGIDVLRHDRITMGDLQGRRLVWSPVSDDGSGFTTDRLLVTDNKNSIYFDLIIGCSSDCYSANVDLIDGIMTSLAVED